MYRLAPPGQGLRIETEHRWGQTSRGKGAKEYIGEGTVTPTKDAVEFGLIQHNGQTLVADLPGQLGDAAQNKGVEMGYGTEIFKT